MEQSQLRPSHSKHKLKIPPANNRLVSLHCALPLQIPVRSPAAGWRGLFLFLCVSLSLLLYPATLHCDPYKSTWVPGPKSSLRLIAAGGNSEGFYRAGVEIRLDPDALTYWRTPGAAGVPPVFSFEGSENAADVAVFYPAPTRINEDGTDAFGYRDRVIFPLHVTPRDAGRPVLLAVHLSYAVCARICLPATAEARLSLNPQQEPGTASPEAAAIAAAEAEVPLRLTPQQRDTKVAIERYKMASPPEWRLMTEQNAEDLFAEAPPGWYFETRKSGRPNEFLLVAAEKPADGSRAPVPVTLTVKSKPQSYEFTVGLDAEAQP